MLSNVFTGADQQIEEFLIELQSMFGQIADPYVIKKFLDMFERYSGSLEYNIPVLKRVFSGKKNPPARIESRDRFEAVSKSLNGLQVSLSVMSVSISLVSTIGHTLLSVLDKSISWLSARFFLLGTRLIDTIGTAMVNYGHHNVLSREQVLDPESMYHIPKVQSPTRERDLLVIKSIGVSLTFIAECITGYDNLESLKNLKETTEDKEKYLKYVKLLATDWILSVLKLWGIPDALRRFKNAESKDENSDVEPAKNWRIPEIGVRVVRLGVSILQAFTMWRGLPKIDDTPPDDLKNKVKKHLKNVHAERMESLNRHRFEHLISIAQTSKTSNLFLTDDYREIKISYRLPPYVHEERMEVRIQPHLGVILLHWPGGHERILESQHISKRYLPEAIYSADYESSYLNIHVWKFPEFAEEGNVQVRLI